ncbi:MAG: hypothetical protein KDA80_13545, partial [Planctomycetaceae bacterium]|nr:hypothetical protein [Planctomycetaceae bacterium]
DSSDINAHGTCAFANVAYTLKITNIYTRNGQQTINTHTVQGTTDSEGIWTDSSSFTVYGAGTWEVQVWLNSDPTEKDSHDGNVGPTF